MPKKDTTTAAKGRKKLTDAEKQHQERLQRITAETSYDTAKATWESLRQQVSDLLEKKNETAAEARAADRARVKAANEQDYLAAQEFKDSNQTLSDSLAAMDAELRLLMQLQDAAHTKYEAMFLQDMSADFNQPETVALVCIRVIDPVTRNHDTVVYTDASDTVQLNVSGSYFESEAYHISSWAAENGFVIRRVEKSIEM